MGTAQGGNSDKIVIATALTEDSEYNLHPNIIVNNKTSADIYVNAILEADHNYIHNEYGYDNSVISHIIVRVWDYTLHSNRNIKQTLLPSPLKVTSPAKALTAPAKGRIG